MSAALVPVAAPLPLTRQVTGLFGLVAGERGPGRLLVQCRSLAGIGLQQQVVHAPDARRPMIPGGVLGILEEDLWALKLGLVVFDDSASTPLRLCALAVAWHVPLVYKNPTRPERAAGRQHIYDELGIEAAIRKAASAPWGGPSITIDGRASVTALWGLSTPIDLNPTGATARASLLLRAMAAALGGVPIDKTAAIGDLFVDIPGSLCRERSHGVPGYVNAVELDLARLYEPAAIESALEKLPARSGRKEK